MDYTLLINDFLDKTVVDLFMNLFNSNFYHDINNLPN